MNGERESEREPITCIVCPNGCQITVKELPDGTLEFDGASCKRGERYAADEFRNPRRMVITTVRVEGGVLPVLPVRSAEPIPKEAIFDAMEVVNQVVVRAPVMMGDVVIPNLLGLGVDLLASRDLPAKN
ncbi:MAG: DUF1667 domain-containing protein [Promethearchaeota archaeon]